MAPTPGRCPYLQRLPGYQAEIDGGCPLLKRTSPGYPVRKDLSEQTLETLLKHLFTVFPGQRRNARWSCFDVAMFLKLKSTPEVQATAHRTTRTGEWSRTPHHTTQVRASYKTVTFTLASTVLMPANFIVRNSMHTSHGRHYNE
eukprot:1590866-Rhodomonas_salina.1